MADAGLFPTPRAANKSMSTVLSRAKGFREGGVGRLALRRPRPQGRTAAVRPQGGTGMRMQSQQHEPHVRAALDEALRAARGAHAKATERVWRLEERIQALEALMQAEPLDPTTQSVRPCSSLLPRRTAGC